MAWAAGHRRRAFLRRLVGALVLCALSARPDAASAKPSNAVQEARLDRTVSFLQEVQNLDGGFGGEAGEESNQDFTAWVALALAAASINPRIQAKPGGVDAYTYLVDHAAAALPAEFCKPQICTTALERELLVVDASGTSPRDFGGIDLLGELLSRELPDGSFPLVPGGRGEINDTAFAVLSLSPLGDPAAQAAVKRGAQWLIGQQNSDGGWSWQDKGSPSEADLTGAAIQALVAARLTGGDARTQALAFLHEIQDPDGGFPELATEHESNSASTAWAVQGIWAAGENPEAWTQGSGREPLGYLASMQQPDGHIRYREREEANGVWMTAYAAPAYAGQFWPIPAPPPAGKAPSAPRAVGAPASSPSVDAAQAGSGGESAPGNGVIAGGGGEGAPLFSRPQPQSKGRRPGGSDDTREHAARHVADRRRNPGRRRVTLSAGVRAGKAASHAAGGRANGSTPHGAGRGGPGGGGEVKGVLLARLAHGGARSRLEPGAPGLRSAGAGGEGRPWLAIGVGLTALLFALAGSLLELRQTRAAL
jgi:prenyltransferase beta subunit